MLNSPKRTIQSAVPAMSRHRPRVRREHPAESGIRAAKWQQQSDNRRLFFPCGVACSPMECGIRRRRKESSHSSVRKPHGTRCSLVTPLNGKKNCNRDCAISEHEFWRSDYEAITLPTIS